MTVAEYYKEMEITLKRADVHELAEQTIARFLNGLNAPIRKIVDFQPYRNMMEFLHQATKAKSHVKEEEQKIERTRAYFASRNASASTSNKHQLPMACKAPSKTFSKQQENTSMAPPKNAPRPSPGDSKVLCFKCGAKGHKILSARTQESCSRMTTEIPCT